MKPQKGTRGAKDIGSEKWRVFCAIELPERVRAELRDHIQQLREALPEVKASWTRVENIHLTLKFFGNVEVERLPLISNASSLVARDFSAFRIEVGKTGVFRTQVLWIGVSDPSGNLARLQQRLEKECAGEGFEREDRAYRPHLTIARLRRPEGARKLADAHLALEFNPIEITIKELVVFRSELSSKGSRYTAISKHQLIP